MNILARNLSREVTEKELYLLFKPFGRITSASLVIDEASGRSKGFGFVEMADATEAMAAIKALNGKLLHGEKIRVKVTNQPGRPRKIVETEGRSNASKGKSGTPRGVHPRSGERPDRRDMKRKDSTPRGAQDRREDRQGSRDAKGKSGAPRAAQSQRGDRQGLKAVKGKSSTSRGPHPRREGKPGRRQKG